MSLYTPTAQVKLPVNFFCSKMALDLTLQFITIRPKCTHYVIFLETGEIDGKI